MVRFWVMNPLYDFCAQSHSLRYICFLFQGNRTIYDTVRNFFCQIHNIFVTFLILSGVNDLSILSRFCE